eukprot:11671734-Alexandrium_andersonii.AAC.1
MGPSGSEPSPGALTRARPEACVGVGVAQLLWSWPAEPARVAWTTGRGRRGRAGLGTSTAAVSYTHLRAHETSAHL